MDRCSQWELSVFKEWLGRQPAKGARKQRLEEGETESRVDIWGVVQAERVASAKALRRGVSACAGTARRPVIWRGERRGEGRRR